MWLYQISSNYILYIVYSYKRICPAVLGRFQQTPQTNFLAGILYYILYTCVLHIIYLYQYTNYILYILYIICNTHVYHLPVVSWPMAALESRLWYVEAIRGSVASGGDWMTLPRFSGFAPRHPSTPIPHTKLWCNDMSSQYEPERGLRLYLLYNCIYIYYNMYILYMPSILWMVW